VTVDQRPTRLHSELHINFDGSQLTIHTNVSEVEEFVASTYASMLVPRVTSSAGRIRVHNVNEGFFFCGTESFLVQGAASSLLDYLRRQIHLHFVRSRPDLLWLHAAALERDGGSLVLAGPSGHGKSTLSTLLCERGWKLMSDEAAPVNMALNEVHPFPQRPMRRLPSDSILSTRQIYTLRRESVDIRPEAIRRQPTPIRMVVFPSFRGNAGAELTRRVPGQMAFDLLRNCTNRSDHGARAVEWVSRISSFLPGYALAFGDAAEAVQLLDGLSMATTDLT